MQVQAKMRKSLTIANHNSEPHRKYIQLTTAIDKHNKHTLTNMNTNIKMNNELIKQYTDAVYWEYKINKPYQLSQFISYEKNMQSTTNDNNNILYSETKPFMAQKQQQVKSTIRKPIKLKKLKSNNSQSIQPTQIQLLNSPTSKISKISLKSANHPSLRLNTQYSQEQTPTRPNITGIKKRVNQTTAGTRYNSSNNHNRSKTGLTTTTLQNNNNIYNSSSNMKQKLRQLQQISVSEFDQLNYQSQTKNNVNININTNTNNSTTNYENTKTNIQNIIHKLDTKILNTNTNTNSKNNDSNNIKYVYCPICQSQLNEQLISQHQQLCKQLQNLYQLPVPQLLQFVRWKVQQHQSAIAGHITEREQFQLQLQATKYNYQQQQQYQQQYQHQQICDNNINNNDRNGRNMRIKSTIQLCGEEVRKCLWFQDIKTQLIAKSQIILNNTLQ